MVNRHVRHRRNCATPFIEQQCWDYFVLFSYFFLEPVCDTLTVGSMKSMQNAQCLPSFGKIKSEYKSEPS